ncbi:unnamed protein product, partial [Ectocarpus sp. 6 AP-2014]
VETEVETENEDSGNEYDDGQGRVAPAAAAAAAAATSTAAGGEEEQQQWWANLIVQQLHRSDPHAMRQLLRKAAFIPAFLRKDVWRLLILGRVEAGGGKDAEGDVTALDAAILSTDLDLENQRVVRVDVERTRPALDQFKRPRVKNLLARILTYHCKTHGLGYKQGMHEVLAPFVALSDPELPTSDISLCYSAFLRRFLPYAFNQDEEFLSLQICFRLFRLLLLYHHPRLCRFLDQYQLQPELYATPWFMTLFSNSLDLPRLYEVWDFYLYWGDPALHHFVVLAFVIGNADAILKAEEANLPETMCRLTDGMRSVEEVRALMRTAKDLMLNTPKSFRKILRSALYANLSQSQMNLVLNTLQVSSCIPVSAEEITSYVLHKNPHRQLDQDSDGDEESVLDDAIASASGAASDAATGRRDCNGGGGGGGGDCSHSLKSPRNGGGGTGGGGGPGKASPSPQRRAERAAMRSLRVHRQYIILDCRPRGEFESCRLAPALHLDPDLLTSPEKLDAKLKEFMPLQGVAHFCLVGAGDDDMGAVGQRKNTSSDLSGEAMGLRTVSNSKSDSPGRAGLVGEAGFLADRGGSGDMFSKPEGGFGRDSNIKEGGFFGGFSRALSRGYGHAAAASKDGEEEIGREEDVQVTRLVLMLLQYNFPFISHVRGDMAAILEELSAQALAEKEGQHADNGDFHETLHGALIGADSDRVREQLMHISPEKTTKGLFAGLSKWSKKDDKGASAFYASKGGGLGSATAGSKGGKAADGDDPAPLAKKNADATAASSRGRGGLGRRDTEDFYMVTKPQDHSPAAEGKSSKRRLFGGVMDRFDNNNNNNNNNARADGDAASSSSLAGAARKQPWLLSPGRSSREARQEAPGREPPAAAAAPFSVLDASAAAEGKPKKATATATWTKPAARKRDTPDRLANFFGKILGVKDDALPDRPIDLPPGGGTADEAKRARSPTTPGVAAAGATGAPSAGEPRASESLVSSSDAAAGRGAAAPAPAAASSAETPLATAVYSATTVSAATADAMPVAVAVAVPLSDPAAPARRPSRSSRTHRTGSAAAAGGSRSEGEVVLVAGTGRVVSIRDWIAKEERENGGAVRVFSAQRVLDGKVQKKCRLAVSRKSLTQFDDVQDGDGGATAAGGGPRGVVTEHRGLRHLARITSRKKHADLIVFHFKSRSGSGASATGTAAAAATASAAASSSSRRSRSSSDSKSHPDILFFFMKDHADCLRMVKENYRKVTQGDASSSSSSRSSSTATAASRRSPGAEPSDDPNRRHGRQTAKAVAGAAAGAGMLVVGAAGAGMAVAGAAGVAVGAAFAAGVAAGASRKDGGHEEREPRSSTSPSQTRRRGGSDGAAAAGLSGEKPERRRSGGWIPIDAPGEERRGSDHGGGGRRPPSSVSRRASFSRTTGGIERGHGGSSSSRRTRGASSKNRSGKDTDGPSWLGRK